MPLSWSQDTLCSYRGSEGEEMVHTANTRAAQQHYFRIDLGHDGVMWVLVHWCDSRRGSGHTAESDGLAPRSTTCTRPTCWILRVAECVCALSRDRGSLLCWLISRCSCLCEERVSRGGEQRQEQRDRAVSLILISSSAAPAALVHAPPMLPSVDRMNERMRE